MTLAQTGKITQMQMNGDLIIGEIREMHGDVQVFYIDYSLGTSKPLYCVNEIKITGRVISSGLCDENWNNLFTLSPCNKNWSGLFSFKERLAEEIPALSGV
jgi:hypothetical protein